MERLQYPIGKFVFVDQVSKEDVKNWKSTITTFPIELTNVLEGITEVQLNTPYRTGGWTARQVIHHLADSHSHALMRFKWSLSEDKPMIKAYDEAEYAKLPDYKMPIDSAILILHGVHQKWEHIMNQMQVQDWEKGYNHPQTGSFYSLKKACALYAWHCMHHLGHIKICKGLI